MVSRYGARTAVGGKFLALRAWRWVITPYRFRA
jgi:hypothetical protein